MFHLACESVHQQSASPAVGPWDARTAMLPLVETGVLKFCRSVHLCKYSHKTGAPTPFSIPPSAYLVHLHPLLKKQDSEMDGFFAREPSASGRSPGALQVQAHSDGQLFCPKWSLRMLLSVNIAQPFLLESHKQTNFRATNINSNLEFNGNCRT